MNMQGSQISKILMNACMICVPFWTIFFSIRYQSSRTVKHHADHHILACEVEPENVGMPIIIKMGNDDLPLRYEKQQLLDLKGYMCRSKLNDSTLLTMKMLGIKKSFRGKCGKKRKVRQKELNCGVNSQYLCSLKKDMNTSDGSKYISFAIVNIKSIRNNAEEFMVYITEDSIDLTFICKSWF